MIAQADRSGIDIYPYLYTMEVISPHELNNFKHFLRTYLSKVEDLPHGSLDNIDTVVSASLDVLVMFIITMQYFFL